MKLNEWQVQELTMFVTAYILDVGHPPAWWNGELLLDYDSEDIEG